MIENLSHENCEFGRDQFWVPGWWINLCFESVFQEKTIFHPTAGPTCEINPASPEFQRTPKRAWGSDPGITLPTPATAHLQENHVQLASYPGSLWHLTTCSSCWAGHLERYQKPHAGPPHSRATALFLCHLQFLGTNFQEVCVYLKWSFLFKVVKYQPENRCG